MSYIHEFGAVGRDQVDDTENILHAIEYGDGQLECKQGDYIITKTIEIKLSKTRRFALNGCGGTAKIIMKGSGPAFRIIGTHQGSADPSTVKPDVWLKQRHPMLANIEIEGGHPEADGIEIIGVFQPRIEGVLIHQVRHGIMLSGVNRNVIISNCNIYHNSGVGIYCKNLNLHQINIIGNHISYNRLGGIRIEDTEIRNLQITGNDIEYNNHRTHKTAPEPTAEIYIDASKPKCTVAEVTIASNTIQATISEGGSNIRIIGPKHSLGKTDWNFYPPCLYAITGNVISSQEINVHLTGCNGVTFSGNNISSAGKFNVVLENSSKIQFSGCNFRPHHYGKSSALKFINSEEIILSACYLTGIDDDSMPEGIDLLSIEHCQNIIVSSTQIVVSERKKIKVSHCSMVHFNACTLLKNCPAPIIEWRGEGSNNMMSSNIIASKNDIVKDDLIKLELQANLFSE